MNLNTDGWDQLLADAITVPGHHDPTPLIADGPFAWREWATAEWSAETALQRLGIALVPWPPDVPRDMVSGVSMPEGIALNPMARNKIRTVAHELAHTLLNHSKTSGVAVIDMIQAMLARVKLPVHEFEADATALLVCSALGQDERELSINRAYLQEYTQIALDFELPKTWTPIKTAATRILSAGASVGHAHGPSVRRPPKRLAVSGPADFARRVRWDKDR